MGGKASNESKRKWNKKTYDQVVINVPKGMRDVLKAYAEAHSMSVNELIKQAITEKTGIDLERHKEEE